ncbi:hypothetical protein [Roseibium sp. LAB1]
MSQSGTVSQTLDPPPASWTAPGQSDSFATAGLVTLLLILFLVVYLYAAFDRFASRKGEATPLRTTIPTMLTIGLAYDLVPVLEDFSLLLPLTLILAALAMDITLWLKPKSSDENGPPEEQQIEEGEAAGGPGGEKTFGQGLATESSPTKRVVEELPPEKRTADKDLAVEGGSA